MYFWLCFCRHRVFSVRVRTDWNKTYHTIFLYNVLLHVKACLLPQKNITTEKAAPQTHPTLVLQRMSLNDN